MYARPRPGPGLLDGFEAVAVSLIGNSSASADDLKNWALDCPNESRVLALDSELDMRRAARGEKERELGRVVLDKNNQAPLEM